MMMMEQTEPTDTTSYTMFNDMPTTGGASTSRPNCCSPVHRGARMAAGRRVVCTGYSQKVVANRAGQDEVYANLDGVVVYDGHGAGRVIEKLRTLSPADVLSAQEPVKYLQSAVAEIPGPTYRDGSTVSLVRPGLDTSEPSLEAFILGDSAIRAYHGDQQIWHHEGHPCTDQEFMLEAQRLGATILSADRYVAVTGPDVIKDKHKAYLGLGIIPGTGRTERLAMTRALGHRREVDGRIVDSILRHDPTYHKIRLRPGDKEYRVVVATDGCWDMICKEDGPFIADPTTTASMIVQLVEKRLKQKWRYHAPCTPEPGPAEHVFNAAGNDDIGVAVWSGKCV